jgi:hemoglobin
MTQTEPLTAPDLAALVDRFYARVREDAELGPIFNGAVGDWPEHLRTLSKFWSSVMLGSGTYKGNPMAVHLRHIEAITPELFQRWLGLWHEVTSESLPPAAAAALQEKAGRIAESLQAGLWFRPRRRPPER